MKIYCLLPAGNQSFSPASVAIMTRCRISVILRRLRPCFNALYWVRLYTKQTWQKEANPSASRNVCILHFLWDELGHERSSFRHFLLAYFPPLPQTRLTYPTFDPSSSQLVLRAERWLPIEERKKERRKEADSISSPLFHLNALLVVHSPKPERFCTVIQ